MSSPSSSSVSSLTSLSTSSSSPTSLNPPRRKRVSAEHTLTRVRENQRRHRARRKDYIASLEQQLAETQAHLAETQAQLAEARADISALKREREKEPIPRKDSATETHNATVSQDEIAAVETALEAIPPHIFALDIDTDTTDIPSLSVTLPPPPPGPPPCCTDTPPAPPTRTPSPECSSCHERPAPAPTESTTLCAQAYVLIAQQNFRGIDAGTIRLWLWQGYRRARREGEGCRVENGALFRLLDYISGV